MIFYSNVLLVFSFYFFCFLCGFLPCLFMISLRNSFYGIIAFMQISLFVSSIIIALSATFLGLSYLLIYLGAMCILFVFVVMMLKITELDETWQINYFNILIGSLIIFLVFFFVQFFFVDNLLYLQISLENFFVHNVVYTILPNIFVIGNVLYTQFALVFLILGLLLLIVLMTSIIITFEYRGVNKSSDIVQQVLRISNVNYKTLNIRYLIQLSRYYLRNEILYKYEKINNLKIKILSYF